ncbi:E3 ubiquitin/ISG15 ligase TRIM25-like [Engystomops pustulosus]|uniref:E3 ubiquitin/ISG15 ligase TRIM25-like n=1 Tax=Engystomops pustulosus TaxID=76066 RepID=UPI003AFA613B
MASADLREELLCSICLSIYTDPITLRCGHNFCRDCIDQHLSTEDDFGGYSCPQCREKTRKRPRLKKNTTLCNVAKRFRCNPSAQGEVTWVPCTYCIHSPVPAVKSCLHCEASLCDDHLRVHSKGPEHVLTDPSTSLENRKCPVHKKILEYYCTEDATCICVTCRLDEEHWGHRVETLDEVSEKKKNQLRNGLQKIATKRKKTEERVQSLEKHWRKAQEKASGEAERVTALFIDLRRRLDDLEKRILREISRQEMEVSLPVSVLIEKLEIKKDELSRKMKNIEELCNMTDPLTVLQEPDTGDLCDPEEGGGDEDTGGCDVDLDVITGMLRAGFFDIMKYLQTISPAHPKETRPKAPSVQSLATHTQDSLVSGNYGQGPANIILDINTAYNNLLISDDLKTATWTDINQNRPDTAERFQDYPQVMSSRGFTSGRHYWDVEIRSVGWTVGMCYPSIDKEKDDSYIAYNKKSWGLSKLLWCNNLYSVIHDREEIQLPHQISSDRVRICLDYEAGELSFYELSYPIRHLHTFTTTFTEPLHAVLWAYEGYIQILGGQQMQGTTISTLCRDMTTCTLKETMK